MEIIAVRSCPIFHRFDDVALAPCSQPELESVHHPAFLFVDVWERIDQDEVSIGPLDCSAQTIVDFDGLTGLFVGTITILN